MEKTVKRQFLRRTIKVGNSAGVLLPKKLLGAEVIIRVVNPPMNPKKDIIKILEPVLEEIIGIYIIKIEEKNAEILAVSSSLAKTIERGKYKIDIVPLQLLKKSMKEKPHTKERIAKAKAILNKRLLIELKKEFDIKEIRETK